MRILYVGHATLWVEAGGLTFLTDPWLMGMAGGRYLHDPELVTPIEEIRSPEIIVQSHAHPDHFHPPSLELLDRESLVVVPRHFGEVSTDEEIDLGWRNPNLEEEVRKLGFDRVVTVVPGERLDLEGGVHLLPVPSHQDRFPEMGMVIASSDGVVYNAVDTWPGEDVLGEVAALQPDIAFLPFRYYVPPAQWAPAALTASARRRLIAEQRRRYRWAGPLRAAQAAAILRPRAVVPGAEGFRDVQQGPDSTSPNYHDISVGEREDLVRLLRRLWTRVAAFPMQPGNRWDSGSGFAEP